MDQDERGVLIVFESGLRTEKTGKSRGRRLIAREAGERVEQVEVE